MRVDIIGDDDTEDLLYFCNQCDLLGYENNKDLKSIRYDLVKKTGNFWGAWHNNKLIAIAGAHPLPEVNENAYRVLFRGCQLYSPHKTLNSCHMNSVPFGDILPHQIKKYYDHELYTTTNVSHDASGKMHRTHKVMSLLNKKGIVSYSHNMILFNVEQSIWKINKDRYLDLRKRLRG
jgi:hypothetical protein